MGPPPPPAREVDPSGGPARGVAGLHFWPRANLATFGYGVLCVLAGFLVTFGSVLAAVSPVYIADAIVCFLQEMIFLAVAGLFHGQFWGVVWTLNRTWYFIGGPPVVQALRALPRLRKPPPPVTAPP